MNFTSVAVADRVPERFHQANDWFSFASLMEYEVAYERQKSEGSFPHTSTNETDTSIEIAAELTFSEMISAEISYEFNGPEGSHKNDELFLTFDLGQFQVDAGLFNVPFGEFDSEFIASPAVEFGETRATAMAITIPVGETVEFSTFIYKGEADPIDSDSTDWGTSIKVSPSDEYYYGFGYLSDLADSAEAFLHDHNDRYVRRVDAINAYATFYFSPFRFSAEIIAALDNWPTLDADRNQPSAWSGELTYYSGQDFDLAFRIQGSSEFEDAPSIQPGMSLAWWLTEFASLRTDIQYNKFKPGLAEDDRGRTLESGCEILMQFGVEL